MSQSNEGILQQFNINELAGATGLILGAVGGILAIVFKSRCYCRLNLCYLCYCERKPPPDPEVSSDDENIKKVLKKEETILEKEDEILDRTEKQEKIIPDKIKIKIEEEEEEGDLTRP